MTTIPSNVLALLITAMVMSALAGILLILAIHYNHKAELVQTKYELRFEQLLLTNEQLEQKTNDYNDLMKAYKEAMEDKHERIGNDLPGDGDSESRVGVDSINIGFSTHD